MTITAPGTATSPTADILCAQDRWLDAAGIGRPQNDRDDHHHWHQHHRLGWASVDLLRRHLLLRDRWHTGQLHDWYDGRDILELCFLFAARCLDKQQHPLHHQRRAPRQHDVRRCRDRARHSAWLGWALHLEEHGVMHCRGDDPNHHLPAVAQGIVLCEGARLLAAYIG